MASLLRVTPSPILRSITKISRLSIHLYPILSSTKPSETNDESSIVTTICKSLHEGRNWEVLTQNFISIPFTNSIVENVLLHLNEPINAKKALNFFHWSAQRKHFQHVISTYCLMIHILVKANLIKDAKALIESVLTKDKSKLIQKSGKVSIFVVLDALIDSYIATSSTPFVFDLFMQTCAKLRLIDDVIEAFRILDDNGVMLSLISYNTMLYVMQKSESTCSVWDVYEHMIEKRKYPNGTTVKIMVDALCKEGNLQKFVDVVDRIVGKRCTSPSVIVNTCSVYRMIEAGRVGDGLVLLKKMLQRNLILDVIGYSLIVFAKVKIGDLEAAWKVFDAMLKRGFDGNSFIYTLFIMAYCEVGKIDEAIEVFEEMENSGFKLYDETFNHLIKGCSRATRVEESLKFCGRMVALGLIPCCSAFNEMVGKLCVNGYTKQGDDMLTALIDKNFVPDENTYSHLISGYANEDRFEDALKLYYEMEYRSLSPCCLAFSSLIVGFCRHKRLKEAEKFLQIMKERSLVPNSFVYETLIASYSDNGDKVKSHELYHEMIGEQ